MRSKLVVCAALAGTCLFGTWSSTARAADSKGKSAKASKAKTGDGLADDKTISKQLQWEDSVMGPDDKKAELEKIARAQAINKAAAEKAAREKEKADAQAAREAAAPKPQTSKRGGEVAIPSVPDEPPKTAEAPPPPPPVKHGDDKFIDKLLKDEPGSKKHKSVDDKALNDLLAVDKPSAKPKRKDDVDSLLQSADKAPPMPETHAKKELPEWAKPEIQNTPQPAPVALRPVPRKNDGVIRVVQGAATPARVVTPAAPTRTASVATRVPASNRRAAASADDWNDPFTSGPKKTVAARDTRHGSDFDDFSSSSRRRPAPAAKSRNNSDDDDWGAPNPKVAPASRPAPAAKPAKKKWKDPFTENVAPRKNQKPIKLAAKKVAHAPVAARTARAARPSHAPVVARAAAPAPSRWQAAGHGVKIASADTGSSAGGWGVLKKHTR